jgi:hypothetical protein
MTTLEQDLIQLRGFRNIEENGKITGFQVGIRLVYYRGLFLPMVRPATVTVDGEVFEGDAITWKVNDQLIEQSELENRPDVHWSSLETAILIVHKKGGLRPGIHNVKVKYDFSASYLPPAIDTTSGIFPTSGEREMVLVR